MESRKKLIAKLQQLMAENKITQLELAERTGYMQSNISRIFAGKYSPSLDIIITIAQAIGYNLTFARTFTEYEKDNTPEFLMCPDPVANQLYILHRNEPVCLIHVVQSTPIRFVVQELYSEMENPEDILNMPFVQRAKDFFYQNVKINEN